jgi:hypothetical protein
VLNWRKFFPVEHEESGMSKSVRNDSQVDAVAAVVLITLAVCFAVLWVSGQ